MGKNSIKHISSFSFKATYAIVFLKRKFFLIIFIFEAFNKLLFGLECDEE